jgi:hypothetical protein
VISTEYVAQTPYLIASYQPATFADPHSVPQGLAAMRIGAPFWHWMERSTNGRFWNAYAGAAFNDKGGNRTFAALQDKIVHLNKWSIKHV